MRRSHSPRSLFRQRIYGELLITTERTTMLIEQTVDKLYQMKLFGMAHALKERLERKEYAEISITDFIGLIVDDEWIYRENNRLTSRLKGARFKDKSACVEDWDHHQPRGLKK